MAAQDPVAPGTPPAEQALPDGAEQMRRWVAVVDVERSLQASPKARQQMDALRAAKDDTEAALQAEKERVDGLAFERDSRDFLSPEWIGANAAWEAARSALEARHKFELERFKIERDRLEAQFHKDLDRAIAELAQKTGVLLVLRSFPLAQDASVTRTLARSSYGDVLYHHQALDLTDDVIKLLKSPAYSDADAGPPSPDGNR